MELNMAIEKFQRHLAVARSNATAKTYSVALSHLAAYGKMESVRTVEQVHPGEFVAYLGEREATTISSYLTALSQFAEFCHTEAILENGKYLLFKRRLQSVRGRTKSRKLPELPQEHVFQAILKEARGDTGGTIRQNLTRLRNIAILETLRATGCRVSEIVNLRRKDLVGNRATVTGKGEKMRIVFFDAAAHEAVMTYLDIRGDVSPYNYVFSRHDRKAKGVMPISATSVRYMIDGLATKAGIDPAEISPHKFRHRFATKVLGATGNLAGVQDMLGHASPTTTRIYARLSAEQLHSLHDAVQL